MLLQEIQQIQRQPRQKFTLPRLPVSNTKLQGILESDYDHYCHHKSNLESFEYVYDQVNWV